MATKARIVWSFLFLYIVAVAVSFQISNVKFKSLNFHTRDYALYLQFASKLLDPASANLYSLNPYGNNWLLFHGTEGINNFHQAIHFEPIKYLYAVLYDLAKTPQVLFLFTSTIFFFPSLYILWTIQAYTKEQLTAGLWMMIIYILFPSSLFLPSYDLRPYLFLPTFFLLSILTISVSRPLWETLLWFNSLFFAREEALILGLVVLSYAFVRIKENPARRRTVFSLLFFYAVWTILTFYFFTWTGYPTNIAELLTIPFNSLRELFILKPVILLISGFLLLGVVIVGWHWLRTRRSAVHHKRLLEIVVFSMVFFPLGYQFFMYELPVLLTLPSIDLVQVLFDPRYHLYFVAILCLGIISLPYINQKVNTFPKPQLLFALSMLFIALHLFASQGTTQVFTKYQSETKTARDVWIVRNLMNPLHSQVLVDYSTHQAFYDFQHVYVYNRLPWHVIHGEGRFYPANLPIVQKIVIDQIDYIIVSRSNKRIVDVFLSESNLTTTVLFENDKFIAIQIIRS